MILQKEEAETKAKEDAERKEKERVERMRREEDERQERKKRLEMIMKRVKVDSPDHSPKVTLPASRPDIKNGSVFLSCDTKNA